MFEATTTHNELRSEKRPTIISKMNTKKICLDIETKCPGGQRFCFNNQVFKLQEMILADIRKIEIVKSVVIFCIFWHFLFCFFYIFWHFLVIQSNVHRPRGMAHQRQGSNFFCCLRAECQKFSATTILLLRGVVKSFSQASTITMSH